jgi:uncharacterized membrane protein YhaH (DUF805 family)
MVKPSFSIERNVAMSFGQAIQTVFRKYADFSGRASRPEYWYWWLFTAIVSFVLNLIKFGGRISILGLLWSLAVLVPSLAVAVRRLRDAGFHWANIFWVLLPFIGWIVIIVLLARPSKSPATV